MRAYPVKAPQAAWPSPLASAERYALNVVDGVEPNLVVELPHPATTTAAPIRRTNRRIMAAILADRLRGPAFGNVTRLSRLHTSPMVDEVRLAFLGGATIYQRDRKFEATATLFAEGPQPAESFFGHYDEANPHALYGAAPDGVESGAALIRFSDGSEADAMLAAVDPDRGGFRLTSSLRDLHSRV